MKKLLFILMCVLISSCSGDEITPATKSVKFAIKGLPTEECSMTRSSLSEESITDLYIWEGETLLCHQTSGDDNFGSPTVSLTVGTHNLTFVASKAEGQSWNEGVWTCTKVKDTFGNTINYIVSKTATENVELNRVVGKIRWTIEDAIPSGSKSAGVTLTNYYYGLDSNLQGVSEGTYVNTFDISSVVGVSGVTLNVFCLPGNIDATVNIDNKYIYTNSIQVQSNQLINIHGNFFSTNRASLISLNSVWRDTTNVSLY